MMTICLVLISYFMSYILHVLCQAIDLAITMAIIIISITTGININIFPVSLYIYNLQSCFSVNVKCYLTHFKLTN